MSYWEWLKIVAILGPIAMMIVLGLVLTLRSGVKRMASVDGLRLVFINGSQAILLLGGCILGLTVIHLCVGLSVEISW